MLEDLGILDFQGIVIVRPLNKNLSLHNSYQNEISSLLFTTGIIEVLAKDINEDKRRFIPPP